MSKPKSPPLAAPATPWLAFALFGLGGFALGALSVYLALPHPATPAAPPAAVAATPAVTLPPPDLTAGLPATQGDRNLGNFYYDQGNWPEAIRHYESALKAGANDPDIRTDLGNAYQFSGRYDDALAQYTAAQQLDPNHEFSLFNQGGLYFDRLNQPQKAIDVWNEYLRRFPQGRNVTVARQLIAQATARLGQRPGASPASALTPDEEKLLRLVPAAAGKP